MPRLVSTITQFVEERPKVSSVNLVAPPSSYNIEPLIEIELPCLGHFDKHGRESLEFLVGSGIRLRKKLLNLADRTRGR